MYLYICQHAGTESMGTDTAAEEAVTHGDNSGDVTNGVTQDTRELVCSAGDISVAPGRHKRDSPAVDIPNAETSPGMFITTGIGLNIYPSDLLFSS